MLRSIPRRLGEEAAGLHDDGVMNAFAAVYKQTVIPEGTMCCRLDEKELDPHFRKVRSRIALPTYHGGCDMRAWRLFQDAAFVGMTSLSYASSQMVVGKLQICAFPALKAVVAAAATKDDGKELGGEWEGVAAMEMVDDLAAAWKICVKQTKKAFPVSQRRPGEPGKPWPGQWIDDTLDGKLRYLITSWAERLPPVCHLSAASAALGGRCR